MRCPNHEAACAGMGRALRARSALLEDDEGLRHPVCTRTEYDEMRDQLRLVQEENHKLQAIITDVTAVNKRWQKYNNDRQMYVQGLLSTIHDLQEHVNKLVGQQVFARKDGSAERLRQQLDSIARDRSEHMQVLELQLKSYKDDWEIEHSEKQQALRDKLLAERRVCELEMELRCLERKLEARCMQLCESGRPSAPVESGRPSAPVESGRPPAPVESGRPSAPVESGRPSAPVESGRPSAPVESGRPSAPVESGRPPAPVESGRPPAPVESGRPPAPVESGRPSAPVESGRPPAPVESGRPSAPVESGRPPAPVESGRPSAPVESGRPPAPVESGRPSAPVESGRPSAPVESGRPSAPVESGRPSAPVESGRPSAPVESGRPSAPVESGRLSAPVESGRPSAPVESGRPSAPVESGRPSASVESGRPPAPVESGRPPAPVESGRPPAPVESGRPPAPVESGRPSAPVESGRPSAPVESGHPSRTYRTTAQLLSTLDQFHSYNDELEIDGSKQMERCSSCNSKMAAVLPADDELSAVNTELNIPPQVVNPRSISSGSAVTIGFTTDGCAKVTTFNNFPITKSSSLPLEHVSAQAAVASSSTSVAGNLCRLTSTSVTRGRRACLSETSGWRTKPNYYECGVATQTEENIICPGCGLVFPPRHQVQFLDHFELCQSK